jgi:hypothetical protein
MSSVVDLNGHSNRIGLIRLFPRISCWAGGVRESMEVQSKSGSAEPGPGGARFFVWGCSVLIGECTPPNGGL